MSKSGRVNIFNLVNTLQGRVLETWSLYSTVRVKIGLDSLRKRGLLYFVIILQIFRMRVLKFIKTVLVWTTVSQD